LIHIIPALLDAQIALETGVIADENEIIPWDGTESRATLLTKIKTKIRQSE